MDTSAIPSLSLKDSLSVLVMSCDAYADTWPPFAFLWETYWPGSPPVFLVTDTAQAVPPLFQRALPVAHVAWTARLHRALQQINTPYVLLLLDDYFLNFKVDNALMQRTMEDCARFGAGAIRLLPYMQKYALPFASSTHYREISPGAPYRVATVPTIWQRAYLLKITEKAYSPWEFERKGSLDTAALPEKILCTATPSFSYEHAIQRGKWLPGAAKLFARHGLALNLAQRPQYSRWDIWKRKWIDRIWSLNPKLIVSIQNRLQK